MSERKADRNKPIVYGGQFVRMANELSLYNLLGYSDNPDIRVSPATLDVYRRLRQHRNTDATSPNYGRAWPTLERLAAELAMTSKTVSKHVKILEAVALIRVSRYMRAGKRRMVFEFIEPLDEKAFRAMYPECVSRYFDALDALGNDTGELDASDVA